MYSDMYTIMLKASNSITRSLTFLYTVNAQEMSTGQSVVMLCGWGVKAGWLIPYMDKCVGGR